VEKQREAASIMAVPNKGFSLCFITNIL
jgi:hypothetical protein